MRDVHVRARHLIVTGGTGYIGARFVARALREGRAVTLLGRQPGLTRVRWVPWTLGDPLPVDALDRGTPAAEQALVHLAHDWRGGEESNVDGTARLFASARDAGIDARVFISSQSARREALNRYGRMKWSAEQRIGDATALRVGLVYGGPVVAMYGLLCTLARLPILPMIEPHRFVQPIHLDEVVDGMFAAADRRAVGVLALAGADPMRFGDVLRMLARSYHGRALPIVPVPLSVALFACDLTKRLPIVPTVDRERVLGLAGTEPIDSAADLARLGVTVLPMGERLAREPGGRRALLAEGRRFVRHAGAEPTSALLRRYARAVTDGAVCRPHFALRWREPLHDRGILAQRLRIAARLAEASASGEIALAGGTRLGRLARLVAQLILEGVMLPARLIAGAARG